MDVLQQRKLQLEGDIVLLERKRQKLLDDIASVQKQHALAFREYKTESTSLKEKTKELVSNNDAVRQELVINKDTKQKIVDSVSNFSQIKIDETKKLVNSMVEEAQRRTEIADIKEKAVLSAFRRLVGTEKRLNWRKDELNEKEVLLNVARQQAEEDMMLITIEKSNTYQLSSLANNQKMMSDSMIKESEAKLKEATELHQKANKQFTTEQSIIEKEKKLLANLKESYQEKEVLLIKRSKELDTKQIWLDDKEETLKRGFQELKNKNA